MERIKAGRREQKRGKRNQDILFLLPPALLSHCYLFFELLLFIQASVVAIAGEELVVGAAFRDATVDEYCNLISVPRG